MNIFVSNLSFGLKDEDLRRAFEEYGEVSSAKVITDKFSGRSRGFGFIEMGDDEGQKAIDELNGADFDGKIINVAISQPREQKPRFSNNRGFGGRNDRDYHSRDRY